MSKTWAFPVVAILLSLFSYHCLSVPNIIRFASNYYAIFGCPVSLSPEACMLRRILISIVKDVEFAKEEHFVSKFRQDGSLIPLFAELTPTCNIRKEIIEGIDVYITTHTSFSSDDQNTIVLDAHGGGFIVGGAEGWAKVHCGISELYGLPIYNVEYLLVPEHSMEELARSFKAVYDHLEQNHKIILSGASAGANLVLRLTQNLVQNNLPTPIAMILHSPWIDMFQKFDSNRNNIGKDLMNPYSVGYLNTIKVVTQLDEEKMREWSPLEHDLKGFPPTFVAWDSSELLADSAKHLVERLRSEGSKVFEMQTQDLWHIGFFNYNICPESLDIVKRSMEVIQYVFEVNN